MVSYLVPYPRFPHTGIHLRFHTGFIPVSYRLHAPHPGIMPPVSFRFQNPVSYPVSYPRFQTGFIPYGRRL
eukprot:14999449-Heterocapsa_arctica.AAC.1